MERISLKLLVAGLLAAFVIGCSSGGETKATKQEEDAFRNPKMTPPPEAGNMGGPPPAATKNK